MRLRPASTKGRFSSEVPALRSDADETCCAPAAPHTSEKRPHRDHTPVVIDTEHAGKPGNRHDATDTGEGGELSHETVHVAADSRPGDVQEDPAMALFHLDEFLLTIPRLAMQ